MRESSIEINANTGKYFNNVKKLKNGQASKETKDYYLQIGLYKLRNFLKIKI